MVISEVNHKTFTQIVDDNEYFHCYIRRTLSPVSVSFFFAPWFYLKHCVSSRTSGIKVRCPGDVSLLLKHHILPTRR